MDKAYVDFRRLFITHQSKAFFVTRAKDNFNFKRICSCKPDKLKGIICDQTVKLKGYKSLKLYPENLRRIKYFDTEQQRTFVFITNNFTQDASDIAMLYKYRMESRIVL